MFSNNTKAPAVGDLIDKSSSKVDKTKGAASCPYPKVVPVYPPVETCMSNISGDSAMEEDQIFAPYSEFKDNDGNSSTSHVSFESQDTFTINGKEHQGNIWGNKVPICHSCICFDLKLTWPEHVVKSRTFKRVSIFLIILNCILAAIGTTDTVTTNRNMTRYTDLAKEVFVYIMSAELFLQFYVNGVSFFANGWLVFDFVIIGLAWIMPNLLVMRTFRVVRTLRLATWVKDLKQLVIALLLVIPKMFAIFFLLLILFVIFSILFTDLFKHAYDDGITQEDYFSRIDITLFTLFQIMTLDGWASICKDIMEDQPWAWVPFVAFVVVSSFFFLNLVIAVVCDAVTSVHQDTVVKYIRDDISAATSVREALKVEDRLDELAGSIQLIMKAQITILEGLQLQQQHLNAQHPISSADSTASHVHEENLRRTTQLLELELQSTFFGTSKEDTERTPIVTNTRQVDFTMCDGMPTPMDNLDEGKDPSNLQFWQGIGLSDDQISRVMARLGTLESRKYSEDMIPPSMLQGLEPVAPTEPTLHERTGDSSINDAKQTTRSTTPEPIGLSHGCWG